MATSDQIRLLLIEDVSQVAQYVRGLLMSQSQIKLIEVIADGGKAFLQVPELRPDVVILDALLQGRVKASQVVSQLREGGINVPVIMLTVPQQPVEVDPARGIHGVLAMPFSGYDLISRVTQVRKDHAAGETTAASISIAIVSNCVSSPSGSRTSLPFTNAGTASEST